MNMDKDQAMTDEQIKQMVERFLSWKLPADFNPDNDISAERPNYGQGVAWEPTGTNLLTYAQADLMVRHILQGVSDVAPDEDWFEEVIGDSFDMDWVARDGARAIVRRWPERWYPEVKP